MAVSARAGRRQYLVCFVTAPTAKQIPRTTTSFFAIRAKLPKRHARMVAAMSSEQRCRRRIREPHMRTFSFLIALAVFLIGPCMAGSSDEHAAGIGTFSYSGTPIAGFAPAMVMAAR
jgi:hypothetical protein